MHSNYVIRVDSARKTISARRDGQSVGAAKVVNGILDEVWVAPAQRGHGMGRRLVRAAIRLGARKAFVVSDIMGSILESLGWSRVGNVYFNAGILPEREGDHAPIGG